jgi:hypothetical protein
MVKTRTSAAKDKEKNISENPVLNVSSKVIKKITKKTTTIKALQKPLISILKKYSHEELSGFETMVNQNKLLSIIEFLPCLNIRELLGFS